MNMVSLAPHISLSASIPSVFHSCVNWPYGLEVVFYSVYFSRCCSTWNWSKSGSTANSELLSVKLLFSWCLMLFANDIHDSSFKCFRLRSSEELLQLWCSSLTFTTWYKSGCNSSEIKYVHKYRNTAGNCEIQIQKNGQAGQAEGSPHRRDVCSPCNLITNGSMFPPLLHQHHKYKYEHSWNKRSPAYFIVFYANITSQLAPDILWTLLLYFYIRLDWWFLLL